MTIDRALSVFACCVAIVAAGLCSTRVHASQIAKTDGTALTMAGTPALSSCGTTPTLAAGSTDYAGTINVGSGVTTACTLSFSATMTNAPACIVSTSLTTVTAGVTTSTSAMTVGMSLTLGGGKISYVCFGL